MHTLAEIFKAFAQRFLRLFPGMIFHYVLINRNFLTKQHHFSTKFSILCQISSQKHMIHESLLCVLYEHTKRYVDI